MEGQLTTASAAGCADKPPGPLRIALNVLDACDTNMADHLDRLHRVIDRLDASSGDAGIPSTELCVPNGHVGVLQDAASRYEVHIGTLGSLVSRLESITE